LRNSALATIVLATLFRVIHSVNAYAGADLLSEEEPVQPGTPL
jgi:hypothetical protein